MCVSALGTSKNNVWIDFNVPTIARLAIVDTLFFGMSLALALN